MKSIMILVLLLLLATNCQGATPLHVYQSCSMPDGVSGQCRSQPRKVTATADVQAGAALELPIDLRLPCTNTTCAEVRGCCSHPPHWQSCLMHKRLLSLGCTTCMSTAGSLAPLSPRMALAGPGSSSTRKCRHHQQQHHTRRSRACHHG